MSQGHYVVLHPHSYWYRIGPQNAFCHQDAGETQWSMTIYFLP